MWSKNGAVSTGTYVPDFEGFKITSGSDPKTDVCRSAISKILMSKDTYNFDAILNDTVVNAIHPVHTTAVALLNIVYGLIEIGLVCQLLKAFEQTEKIGICLLLTVLAHTVHPYVRQVFIRFGR